MTKRKTPTPAVTQDFVPKSDAMLALEAKEIMQAYVAKANELMTRGLVISFSVTNGSDGQPCELKDFKAIKVISV